MPASVNVPNRTIVSSQSRFQSRSVKAKHLRRKEYRKSGQLVLKDDPNRELADGETGILRLLWNEQQAAEKRGVPCKGLNFLVEIVRQLQAEKVDINVRHYALLKACGYVRLEQGILTLTEKGAKAFEARNAKPQ